MSSVTFGVLVNGERIGPIVPSPGIRQGDPLSPYLFIICAEGLSRKLKQVEHQGDIRGVQVCKRAPSISHLLFAYDSFIFCKVGTSEAQKLKVILEAYRKAPG